MSRWDPLLSLQEHDTAIDQLVHRRATLPARGELDAAMAELRGLDASAATVEEQRSALAGAQQRLEDEIVSLAEKANQHDKALYSGTTSNPRELQAMQDEIASLRRRISQLEDQEIEVMEQLEPLDAELSRFAAARAHLDERAAALRASIAEDEVTIDDELATVRAERDTLAASIGDDVLGSYDRLRAQAGGIAIARLVGGSCGGCHLALPAVEVDRIKKLPPDDEVHCEECGRLLVR